MFSQWSRIIFFFTEYSVDKAKSKSPRLRGTVSTSGFTFITGNGQGQFNNLSFGMQVKDLCSRNWIVYLCFRLYQGSTTSTWLKKENRNNFLFIERALGKHCINDTGSIKMFQLFGEDYKIAILSQKINMQVCFNPILKEHLHRK